MRRRRLRNRRRVYGHPCARRCKRAVRFVIFHIKRHIGLAATIIIIALMLYFYYSHLVFTNRQRKDASSGPSHKFVWWNRMHEGYVSKGLCGLQPCEFTSDRSQLAGATGVLFYGSDLEPGDMPIPRNKKYWALLHEESPRNVQFIPHTRVLKHFNFTSTFSRLSDFPLPTQYLPSARNLISRKFLVPITLKTVMRRLGNIAPVAFIQSDCDSMSGREEYVKRLMEYIKIDSYGSCLNNIDLPQK